MTDEERALIRRLALLERGFTPIPLYGKAALVWLANHQCGRSDGPVMGARAPE